MAWLTDAQKDKMYNDWLTGKYSLYQLANMYGVSQATVSNHIGKQLNKKS